LQQRFGVLANIPMAEDRIAGHKNFRTGANDVPDGIERDAAIDFDAKSQAAGIANVRKRFHFLKRVGNEMLCAKSRIHGHDQNVVHDVQNFVKHVHRSGRINDHSRLAAMRLDQMESAVQMNTRLLMNGNPVRTCFSKSRNELIRIFDHQMTIERHIGESLAERSHDRRPNREVRHEVPVHHVEVQHSAAALQRGLGFESELREVSGQYRGC